MCGSGFALTISCLPEPWVVRPKSIMAPKRIRAKCLRQPLDSAHLVILRLALSYLHDRIESQKELVR